MLKDRFAERLKQLRKEKDVSQYKAADDMKISRGKLANYEQGTRQPDREMAIKLAEYFNCSIDYLYGADINIKEEQLLYDIEGMSLEELQEKYSLTIDGKAATKKEIEGAIAFIRALRGH